MPRDLRDAIATQIRRYRRMRDLSVRQLAERCEEIAPGRPNLTAAALAAVERGPTDVTVADLLVLAEALRVPPVLLVCRLDSTEPIAVTPRSSLKPWEAARWISGEYSGPGSEEEHRQWRLAADPILDLRRCLELIIRYSNLDYVISHGEQMLSASMGPIGRDAMTEVLAERRRQRYEIGERIVEVRSALRRAGVEPPEMPAEMAHLAKLG